MHEGRGIPESLEPFRIVAPGHRSRGGADQRLQTTPESDAIAYRIRPPVDHTVADIMVPAVVHFVVGGRVQQAKPLERANDR